MNEQLSREDLHHVVSRIPRDVRQLIQKRGLIVAGGCIRSLVAGEPVADFDLFGSSKEMLELAAKDLTISRKGRLYSTDNAFTVLTPNRAPIQFIHRWVYQSPQDVGNDFDFSIAQAVVWWAPHPDPENPDAGEWMSAVSEFFYSDLASKRLRYLAPARAEDAGGSLLRVRKFLKRGYHIEAPSLALVVARLCMGVEQIAETMNNESNRNKPGFHTRENRDGEMWLAKLLTGKLREVDPMAVIDGLEIVDEHTLQHVPVEGEGNGA